MTETGAIVFQGQFAVLAHLDAHRGAVTGRIARLQRRGLECAKYTVHGAEVNLFLYEQL